MDDLFAGTEYQACGSGCELTCDNFESIENNLSCSEPFMERCGCPKNQVSFLSSINYDFMM